MFSFHFYLGERNSLSGVSFNTYPIINTVPIIIHEAIKMHGHMLLVSEKC